MLAARLNGLLKTGNEVQHRVSLYAFTSLQAFTSPMLPLQRLHAFTSASTGAGVSWGASRWMTSNAIK